MTLTYKTYNIATGFIEFKLYYEETIAGALSPFEILSIGQLEYGYDNENNLDIAIYPANISLTIDDFNGDNYAIFTELLSSYSATYPFNFDDILTLEILVQGQRVFKGILDELESDSDSLELTLRFVDGVNKLRDINIGNPYVLDWLHRSGLLTRTALISNDLTPFAYSYGFKTIKPYSDGYGVKNLHQGDSNTSLQGLITSLFRLLDRYANVSFDNAYKFGDLNELLANYVTIDQVKVRRILSNLLGRYVVLSKSASYPTEIVNNKPGITVGDPGIPDYNYNKPERFDVVYEDTDWKVYYHNWDGNPDDYVQLKFEKGIDERSVSGLLKTIAKNLFSYYGFKTDGSVYWKHRRFTSSPVDIQRDNILSMSKILTVDRTEGVKIVDYYNSGQVGMEGTDYGGDNSGLLTYRIPLNTYATENGFEYRMTYGSTDKEVIYFYDTQIDYKEVPMEVIARSEYLQFQAFRDKYEITLDGIDYSFHDTYRINYRNYSGTLRPVTMSVDLVSSQTTLTGLEIG